MTHQDHADQLMDELIETRAELTAIKEEFYTFRVKVYESLLEVSQFELMIAERREKEILKAIKNFKTKLTD